MATEEIYNSDNIFENNKELNRLSLQNRLLRSPQMPVFEDIFSHCTCPRILDIGCNNGMETYERFARFSPSKVVGLEKSEHLVQDANRSFGNDVFSFFACDVESGDFLSRLTDITHSVGIRYYDVIHISLVLLHLRDPLNLLKKLRMFLSEQGKIVIIEPDDGEAAADNDSSGVVRDFMEHLAGDPLAGNRFTCHRVSQYLFRAGYKNIADIPAVISAEASDSEKSTNIHDMYFSFLGDDARMLAEDSRYAAWSKDTLGWLDNNADRLKELFDGRCGVKMVIRMFVADAGVELVFSDKQVIADGYTLSPLEYDDLDSAVKMFDECVGDGLYTRQDLVDMLEKPLHYVYILRDTGGVEAGYLCFTVSDAEEIAKEIKIGTDKLTSLAGKSNPTVMRFRSMGMMPDYRRRHLATSLTHHFINIFNMLGCDLLVGAFWKIGDTYPMYRIIKSFDFRFGGIIEHPWSDVETLYCPVCHGRCMCDAGLFYITQEGNP